MIDRRFALVSLRECHWMTSAFSRVVQLQAASIIERSNDFISHSPYLRSFDYRGSVNRSLSKRSGATLFRKPITVASAVRRKNDHPVPDLRPTPRVAVEFEIKGPTNASREAPVQTEMDRGRPFFADFSNSPNAKRPEFGLAFPRHSPRGLSYGTLAAFLH
jgi:hypothetical protein